jgi:hypothetical protein
MSKIYTKIDTLEFGKITKAQGAMIRVVASRELYTSAIKHLDIKFVASRGVDSCGDYYKVVRASDSKVLLQSSANILKNED